MPVAKNMSVADLIANGTRFCYTIPYDAHPVPNRGYRVSLVVEGVQGHFPTGTTPEGGDIEPWYWGPTRDEADATCQGYNQQLGHSPHDVAMIITSTMGGKIDPQHVRPAKRGVAVRRK